MFNLSMNQKLSGVLLFIFTVCILISIVSLSELGKVNDQLNTLADKTAKKMQLIARSELWLTKISELEKSLIIESDPKEMEKIEKSMKELMAKMHASDKAILELLDPANREIYNNFDTVSHAYFEDLEEVLTLSKANSDREAELLSNGRGRQDFEAVMVELDKVIEASKASFQRTNQPSDARNLVMAQTLIHSLMSSQRSEKNMILTKDQEQMLQYQRAGDEYIASAQSTFLSLRQSLGSDYQDSINRIETRLQQWIKTHQEIVALALENSNSKAFNLSKTVASKKLLSAQNFLAQLAEYNESEFNQAAITSDQTYDTARNTIVISSTLGILITAIIAFFVLVSVSRMMNRAVRNLQESSIQIGSAASNMSEASQQLSSMANEQASSLQETSASLQEIGGMVDSSAENADRGTELSQKVKAESVEAKQKMEELERAMSEILESNHQIEELVKVIGNIGEKTQVMDEIVFQTKLLSFNASVEAERAGEHGRGFAVVAQEVGNLAQMSGKAAKEIAEIVKNSIHQAQSITSENKAKVERGSNMVVDVSANLKAITKRATEMNGSSEQIQSASREQAGGIKQINEAITQLDRATQENAATAEQTASASEELAAQTQVLSTIVSELLKVVKGNTQELQAPRNPSAVAFTAEPKVQKQGQPNSRVIPLRKAAKTVSPSGESKAIAAGQDFHSSNDDDSTAEAWEKL